VRGVYFSIIPGAIETHDMIFVAMAEEETVLRQVIAHELKVINTDV